MNIILGNSVSLPFHPERQVLSSLPLTVSGATIATLAVPPPTSTYEPAALSPAGSPQRRSDTQRFLQRVFGLNVQLAPPGPSALAD